MEIEMISLWLDYVIKRLILWHKPCSCSPSQSQTAAF